MNYKYSSFEIDRNIMFVIQNYIGDRTEEMLVAFYDMANSIVSESLKSTRAKSLNKRCNLFYKKTKIPILFTCSSMLFEYHEKHGDGKPLLVSVEIRFPKHVLRADPKQLEEIANQKFEKNIGLRDDMTKLINIDTPEVKVPRTLKGVL